MAYYDDRLKELHQKISQKQRLQSMKAELGQQLASLSRKAAELEKIKAKEQADVDKLEGRSILAWIYRIAGNKEEKISKERQEAYAAAMKYESAKRELDGIESDLRYCETELAELMDCEAEYEDLLNQKKASVKASGSAKANEILHMEEQLMALEHEIKELEEALDAGCSAHGIAKRIVSELTEADSLADWDMFMDSMLIDMQKHEHIENAQSLISSLQGELRRFKTELADVQIQGSIHIEMDDFSKFADCFFDNIFTDWDIMDKIDHSLREAQETEKEIKDTISLLKDMRDARIVSRLECQERLEEFVVGA